MILFLFAFKWCFILYFHFLLRPISMQCIFSHEFNSYDPSKKMEREDQMEF